MSKILDPEVYKLQVFEPAKVFSFIVKIPHIPSYCVKSCSKLNYVYNHATKFMEWDPVSIEFYTPVNINIKEQLLSAVGACGRILSIDIQDIDPSGDIYSITTLSGIQVLSLDFGDRAYDLEGLSITTLTIKPGFVNIK